MLINGVECDPGLVHDAWIYRNRLDAVERGVQILKESLALQRAILATREPLRKTGSGIEQGYMKKGNPMVYAMELYAPFFLFHTVEGKSEELLQNLEEHVRVFRKNVRELQE